MKLYTYTEARQNLASLLKQTLMDGEVKIKRKDGQIFIVRPQVMRKSPFDVKGINLGISTSEILEFVAECRRNFKQIF